MTEVRFSGLSSLLLVGPFYPQLSSERANRQRQLIRVYPPRRIGQRRGARRGRIRTTGVVVVVCPPPRGGIIRLYLVTTEAWIAPLAA
eukprot:COSAG05_NODE_10127_length_582_cov_0.610766_1_plen_88_part_00